MIYQISRIKFHLKALLSNSSRFHITVELPLRHFEFVKRVEATYQVNNDSQTNICSHGAIEESNQLTRTVDGIDPILELEVSQLLHLKVVGSDRSLSEVGKMTRKLVLWLQIFRKFHFHFIQSIHDTRKTFPPLRNRKIPKLSFNWSIELYNKNISVGQLGEFSNMVRLGSFNLMIFED